MITSFNTQFKELQAHHRFSFAKAESYKLPEPRLSLGDEVLITIPNVPIPKGWSHEFITLAFVISKRMHALPRYFWTHEIVTYGDRSVPQLTQHGYEGYPYPNKCKVMWFYRPADWSIHDTLITYANFMRTRFFYSR